MIDLSIFFTIQENLVNHLQTRYRRFLILYISADHIRIEAIGLYEVVSRFFQMGGKVLIIDEIHKYTHWPKEVKNLYDAFPAAQIVFSGSSTPDSSSEKPIFPGG